MPAVSLLMVFHRDSPYLRPAIASVLSQTWRDLELVLVDNGTGLSADALGESGRDPRLRWVRLQRNEGIPGGHNAGVAAANGEFIALQDYDDLSQPYRLARQVEALRRNPALAWIAGRAELMDENERRSGKQVFCLPRAEEHHRYAPYGAPLVTPAMMGTRELFRSLPYRPEFPFAADLDFQARAAERWSSWLLPEVVLRYRWYPAQTTQQRRREIEQSRCLIQLLAARRRAGRPENLVATLAAITAESAGETWRRGARMCLAEGCATFAAYQARRSFVCDRSVTGAAAAARLAARAWRSAAPGERRLVAQMFFRGPVRALRLHPGETGSDAPGGA